MHKHNAYRSIQQQGKEKTQPQYANRHWIRETRAFILIRTIRNAIRFLVKYKSFVKEQLAQNTEEKYYNGPTIFVFGSSRIGKSILCNRLSEDIKIKIVSIDGLVDILIRTNDPNFFQIKALLMLVRRLKKDFPMGYLIDFAILSNVFVNQPDILIKEIGIHRIFLISSQADAKARCNAILEYRKSGAFCWTKLRCSDKEIPAFAESRVRHCEMANRAAERVGLHPIYINPNKFDEDIAKSVEIMKQRISKINIQPSDFN